MVIESCMGWALVVILTCICMHQLELGKYSWVHLRAIMLGIRCDGGVFGLIWALLVGIDV